MTRDSGFSIVRFSPDPEEIERVNVALLLWGADAPIRFRDDFPKLRCIAGDAFPRWFLVEYLRRLGERARELPPEESYVALNSVSAQMRVSRFRATPRVADPAFVDALTNRYLAAHGEGPRRKRSRPSIEKQLDDALRQALPLGAWQRKPTPTDLFGPALANSLFGNEQPRVARAFSGTKGFVLLDGLDLTAPTRAIEERAGRLSYAFHRFGSAQAVLEPPRNELRRLAVFLGEVQPGSANDGVRRWACEKLRQDALLVDEQGAAMAIRREAERVGALLPSN